MCGVKINVYKLNAALNKKKLSYLKLDTDEFFQVNSGKLFHFIGATY